MNNLALALRPQNQTDEADAPQRQAVVLQESLSGANDFDLTVSWHNLATSLASQGQFAEAEDFARRAPGAFRHLQGDVRPAVATAQRLPASIVQAQPGRTNEAEMLQRETLRLKRELDEPGHVETSVTLRNLAWLLARSGRLAEAEALSREALADTRRGEAFSPRDLENCLYDVGSVEIYRAWVDYESAPGLAAASSDLLARGREAEGLLRECLALHAQSTGTNDAPYANLLSHIASAMTLAAALERDASERERGLACAETLLLDAHTRLQASTRAPA